MGLADGYAAEGIVFGPIGERSAVQSVLKGRGREAGLSFVAEPAEDAVFVRYFVVQANIEVVAAGGPSGIGDKIGPVHVGVGSRKKGGKPGRKRVDRVSRKNIGGDASCAHPDGHPANAAGIQRGILRQTRVENFAHVRRISVAIDGDLIGRVAVHVHGHGGHVGEKTGKVTANFLRGRNQRQLRQGLYDAKTFVVGKEERLVFSNWAAQGGSELILVVR